LEKGAKLDLQDKKGWTALMYSVYYGDIKSTRILVDGGADLSIKNKKGYTAVDLATLHQWKAIIKYFESKTTEKKPDA
jgi:ankyrin repeat protein